MGLTMARRNDHTREQLKEMALAAAAGILDRDGYGALSTRKVAAKIGYTVGSLYFIFRNLDDLILQLNARTLEEMHEAMRTATADCAAPRDCIATMAYTYIRFATENHARWSLLFEHRTDEQLPPWYQERIVRIFASVEQVLRRIGGRHGDKDTQLAARALWSGIHGVCVLGLMDKLDTAGAGFIKPVADSLVENYLTGFTGRPATRRAHATSARRKK